MIVSQRLGIAAGLLTSVAALVASHPQAAWQVGLVGQAQAQTPQSEEERKRKAPPGQPPKGQEQPRKAPPQGGPPPGGPPPARKEAPRAMPGNQGPPPGQGQGAPPNVRKALPAPDNTPPPAMKRATPPPDTPPPGVRKAFPGPAEGPPKGPPAGPPPVRKTTPAPDNVPAPLRNLIPGQPPKAQDVAPPPGKQFGGPQTPPDGRQFGGPKGPPDGRQFGAPQGGPPGGFLPGAPKGPVAVSPGRTPAGMPQRLDQVQKERRERVEDGGRRRVIEEPGNRFIIKQDNRIIIRHDESERFRRGARDVRANRRPDGTTETYFLRPDGSRVINVVDRDGRLLRRYRRGGDGREINIIDNRRFYRNVAIGVGVGLLGVGVLLNLPRPVIDIPRERYIVDYERASDDDLYETLIAPPIGHMERAYSLDEVRYNYALRDRMRRIDLDTITFEFGSFEIAPDQFRQLERMARAINRVLEQNPDEVFLIEGHTDAVGSQEDNLSLSDRRAQTVAEILTESFGVPAENLVTQGYGEQFLKIDTPGPERLNRRVAVRRISPLMTERTER
jgi:outer membrane protein OmpA-like peptidoglycan-associated protein